MLGGLQIRRKSLTRNLFKVGGGKEADSRERANESEKNELLRLNLALIELDELL